MRVPNRPSRSRETFATDAIRRRLEAVGLKDFEAIWAHAGEWVEPPNFKRRGWSGVCRLELNGSGEPPLGIYLKRQENHAYRSLRRPLQMQPTAWREYRRLMAMRSAAIATPEVLYYGQRLAGGRLQAVLMTREVPGSISLDDYLRLADRRPAAEVRYVLAETAALIARLHRAHFQHCALYGKHVLIRGFETGQRVRPPAGSALLPVLIDVEKTRRRPSRLGMALKDLSQFYRRTPWTEPHWTFFLEHYVAAGRMPHLKRLLAWRIRRRKSGSGARRRPFARLADEGSQRDDKNRPPGKTCPTP